MVSRGFCSSAEGWGPWSNKRGLDLTPCFEYGVVSPLLNILFIGLSVHRLRTLQSFYALPPAYTKTAVYWIKLLLAGIIVAASGAELVHSVLTKGIAHSFNVFTLSLFIQTVAFSIAANLHYYEQTRARSSSSILLLYWLLTAVSSAVTLRTNLEAKHPSRSHRLVWTSRFASIAAIAAIFCAELWPRKLVEYVLAEDDDNDEESAERFGVRSPEEDANIFSRLVFEWMSPLLKTGRAKLITQGDLWDLPRKYRPSNVATRFEANWQYELDNALRRTPSLVRALWKTLGLPYLLAGLFKLIQDILQFTQPVLLSRLIGFVASYATEDPQPASYGYFYAASMLVLQLVQTIFLHQYFQLGMTTGMKAKSSLTTAIYKKALRLSNETRQEYTTGSITTLFSVDVERIGGVTDYAHIAWSGPVQIIFAVYLLYNTLGWSVFAGIVVMIISVPLNGWLTAKMRKLQIQQMKNKDKRTTLIDEALSGIKVIKLYAWEKSFLDKIKHVRESLELVTLRDYGVVFAFASVSMMAVPFLVSFMTFLIYATFDGVSHGPLTAQLIFVSLSLFNLLRFPLTMFPIIVSSLVDASVALGRIYKLLTSDELDPEAVTRLESVRVSSQALSSGASSGKKAVAVRVTDGSFLWSRTG
ncbi:hypothetical protein GGI12_003685, partial [Dipsacomyces acuminosporus]